MFFTSVYFTTMELWGCFLYIEYNAGSCHVHQRRPQALGPYLRRSPWTQCMRRIHQRTKSPWTAGRGPILRPLSSTFFTSDPALRLSLPLGIEGRCLLDCAHLQEESLRRSFRRSLIKRYISQVVVKQLGN